MDHEITELLSKAGAGDPDCLNRLYERIQAELRTIAAHKMASQPAGHTLQATALVNEAYLKLGGSEGREWKNRAHFFSAAAQAMRCILVDSARRKRGIKHGGGQERVELAESQIVGPAEDDLLLQVNEALETLAMEDPVKAEIVKLRFYVGLNHQEIADALELSEKTVRRHWRVAKIRLYELISEPSGPSPGSP